MRRRLQHPSSEALRGGRRRGGRGEGALRALAELLEDGALLASHVGHARQELVLDGGQRGPVLGAVAHAPGVLPVDGGAAARAQQALAQVRDSLLRVGGAVLRGVPDVAELVALAQLLRGLALRHLAQVAQAAQVLVQTHALLVTGEVDDGHALPDVGARGRLAVLPVGAVEVLVDLALRERGQLRVDHLPRLQVAEHEHLRGVARALQPAGRAETRCSDGLAHPRSRSRVAVVLVRRCAAGEKNAQKILAGRNVASDS